MKRAMILMKSMQDVAAETLDEADATAPSAGAPGKRLMSERPLWSASPEAFEVLAAGLELIAQPVVLMNERGRLVIMNGLARAAIDRDRSLLVACAGHVLRGTPDARIRSAAQIAGAGTSAHHLLVLETARSAGERPDDRLERVRVECGLTVAEVRVLAYVVRGDSNKDIATSLACAVRTVEVHVTSIFRKCGAESRARLVAWFWTST